MKTKLLLLLITLTLISCENNSEPQPLTGSNWGEIYNHSIEQVVSSDVKYWEPTRGNGSAVHFFSSEAKEGTKSLTIYSNSPKNGRWHTNVNVKPWSTYSFSGWIKTENLFFQKGEGAGFNLLANGDKFSISTMPEFFKGTNSWTKVEFQFNTGDQDCLILECLYNKGGMASGRVWFDDMKIDLVQSDSFQTSISIDIEDEKEEMPVYIYGQFIEHLGRCIYGGIWAEMLNDRKFFYAPGSANSPWKIGGDQKNVTMDLQSPYVGDQSPILINTKNNNTRIFQSDLGVNKGMKYEGRVILKSEGINQVRLVLSWGTEQKCKKTKLITGLSSHYETYPVSFLSDTLHENASLSIEPLGQGRLWIGAISLMPGDNIDGFRSDVLALLKELNSPVYRWPGGNFVSGYNWKDGIGDRDTRPPRKNPAWTGIEHNDVGIHEFLHFCELLKTEAYIAVNAGMGSVESARQEVEYCNGAANTTMGKLRSANGHSDPWAVRWWSIGNEMYGGWQLGHMSTEQFVKKHNEFAQAMWSVDHNIKLVAVGNPGNWDEMVLSNCSENMNYISEHFYRGTWHGGGLMTHVRQIPDAICEKADIHRKYREDIPALKGKDIRICMDEWNYWYGPHVYGELGVRYFMRDALGIAAGINEFSRQSDIIFMANYAQTVNVIGAIKTTSTSAVLSATGEALKMYRQYFGSIPVAISGETRPLDIAATLSGDRKFLIISVVNPGWDKQLI
ncbi:MAG: hypothetical protein J7L96_09065, partial [Bacteroidales bacterium]|nr:hypothetical protein [Bacteroidales bacterium]